jgi:hypothetical protein
MPDASLVLATRDANMLAKAYASDVTFPADTIDFGADWTDDWDNVGYTNGGIGTSLNVDRAEIRVDQLFYPVDRPITGGSVRFDTNFAQFSPENLRLASGIGELADPVAPGASTRGHTQFDISADFEEVQLSTGIEARKRDGEAFRGVIYRCIPISTPNPRLGQADSNAQTAFEVEALPPDNPEDHMLASFRSIIPATGE